MLHLICPRSSCTALHMLHLSLKQLSLDPHDQVILVLKHTLSAIPRAHEDQQVGHPASRFHSVLLQMQVRQIANNCRALLLNACISCMMWTLLIGMLLGANLHRYANGLLYNHLLVYTRTSTTCLLRCYLLQKHHHVSLVYRICVLRMRRVHEDSCIGAGAI